MDGGSGEPVAWRSSIPGVSQRDGAPASLGLVVRGLHAASMGEAGEQRGGGGSPIGPAGGGRSGGRRGRRVVPWRAVGMAAVALVAIVGVARAAGVDAEGAAGDVGATSSARWETLGSDAGSAVGSDVGSAPGMSGGSAPMPDSVAPSSAGSPTPQGLAPFVGRGDEPPDWRGILAELDARRGRALTEVDPALLLTYAQEGSAAWVEDAALLADMAARGLRPRGLASRVVAVETIDNDGTQARLQVVDERAVYSLVDSEGSVVQEVEPAGPRRWTVTLVRLAPAATDPSPADPGESPEGADVLEGIVVPGHASGRDPGWRVAAVEPAEVGESWDSEEGADAPMGAEGSTSGDGP